MPAMISSVGVDGARYAPPAYSGAGRARASSFPLGVNGSASIASTAAGTM
ncbi:hypothetical protein PICSAR26_04533 [Mycobacterium avium subsp. paratuberculosis]|nr:hypothetical protein PICSAR26_04533 [Mycobacterium avium subsp. paratuberculosis]